MEPSTVTRYSPHEVRWLAGHTFCLMQRDGKYWLSRGKEYQPCVVFPPVGLRPMVPVGDIGGSNEPPNVEFPQTRRDDCGGSHEVGYVGHGASCKCRQCTCEPDPPSLWCSVIVIVGVLVWALAVVGVWSLVW